MITLDDGTIVGFCTVKDEDTVCFQEEDVVAKGLDNVQAFFSNNIFFVGKMAYLSQMEPGSTPFSHPVTTGYQKELHFLEADDLPLEKTATELGYNFFPVIKNGEIVAAATPGRKVKLLESQGMRYLEINSDGIKLQADCSAIDYDLYKSLKEKDVVLIAGNETWIEPVGKIVLIRNPQVDFM